MSKNNTQAEDKVIGGESLLMNDDFNQINSVLVRDDENGKIKAKIPTIRDESGKMQYMEVMFKKVDVPPEQVVWYTQSPFSERNTGFSQTVELESDRHIVVFDRTYIYNGKKFTQCAWVPSTAVRAGLIYKKMIQKGSNKPIAVMKRTTGQGNTPLCLIVGKNKEEDYRDLKRVFERVFIKKGAPGAEDDEQLGEFMINATPAIPEEVV